MTMGKGKGYGYLTLISQIRIISRFSKASPVRNKNRELQSDITAILKLKIIACNP